MGETGGLLPPTAMALRLVHAVGVGVSIWSLLCARTPGDDSRGASLVFGFGNKTG